MKVVEKAGLRDYEKVGLLGCMKADKMDTERAVKWAELLGLTMVFH